MQTTQPVNHTRRPLYARLGRLFLKILLGTFILLLPRIEVTVKRVPSAVVAMPFANVVNGRGKYLIPGLWDMHVHPREYEPDIAFPMFIATGVTGVRDAGTQVPLSTITQWKREIVAGTRVGPRYLVSGPQIDRDRAGPG